MIGDGILFHLEQNSLVYVGRAPAANWLEFHATSGKYDVKIKRDDRSPSNPGGKAVIRTTYRFQIQGPNAKQMIEKLNGGPFPEIKFFNMGEIKIKGKTFARCGTAWPALLVWRSGDRTKSGRKSARRSWKRARNSVWSKWARAPTPPTRCESGWIPSPLPAVYTGEKMKAYRQWLPANSYEATGSLAGSFVSNNIEDYYMTPYELGYGTFVKFDHDFIGREALEKIDQKPQRKKVTFAWNAEDVVKTYQSLLEPGDPYKYIDLPISNYASSSYDKVVTKGGKTVGLSMFAGYSYNERSVLSLGIVDPDVEIGTELTLVWGEEGGGTKKATVERHKQMEFARSSAPCRIEGRSRNVRLRLAHGEKVSRAERGAESRGADALDPPLFY